MSARKTVSIKKWGRTVTILDGEAGIQFPADSLNAKLSGLTYKPRDGYNEAVVAPGGAYASLGFGYVTNGDLENVESDQVTLVPTGYKEFISIENRAGTVRPYSVHEDTLARTQIGTLALTTDNWWIQGFYGKAYLGNPGGTKPVYAHNIGDTSSLYTVEDTTYSAPSDPTLVITRGNLETVRSWIASATDTYTYPIFDHTHDPATITVTIADGSATLAGVNDDDGPLGGQLQVQCIYAANKDMSGFDYLSFEIEGQSDMETLFPEYTTPEFRIAGVWTAASGARWYTEGTSGTYVMYVKGMTLTAVQGFRFTVNYDPTRGESSAGNLKDFMTISPIKGGGTYLTSTNATHRLWDTTLDTDSTGITYGVQYGDATFAVVSAISQGTISNDEAFGFPASTYSIDMGGRITLSAEAPSGAYDRMRFLRLDESVSPNKWKIISTVTVSPWGYKDTYSEYEIPALTNNGDGTSPGTVPAFTTAGVVFMFPFKQSAVWLTSDGTGNIKISRVGDPEEIYDSEVTYDADDLTQPAQRTLADDQSDQPVWGVQAGANAFICGARAAYALSGDFPVNLSPSRQIPGSRGIAGMYAGCRFRPTGGTDGAAYLDPEGNVWLVNSVPEFTDDTRAKPHELSSMVRHKIKTFLYNEQLAEFPTLAMADALLEFQEATSSLWVILGRRAAVYRQDELGSGWEFYEYSLASTGTQTACRDYTNGTGTPTSETRASGLDWTLPAYGGLDDTNYATCSLTFPTLTKLLRSAGISPVPLLPVSATVTEVHLRLRHWKVGDIPVTHDWTKLVVSGTPVGANLSTAELLNDSETILTYDLTSSLPSLADINAGNVGFELGYTSEQADAGALIGGNFNVVVTNSTSSVMTVTTTYTGGGTKPSFVYVNITSRITVNGQINPPGTPSADPEMHAEGDNGLTGGTGSGTIYPTGTPLVVETTERVKITLTAGVGHVDITRVGSAVPLPGTVNWIADISYTGSAVFSAYVPSVVYVDSMEISYCFSVTSSVTSGVSWQRGVFTVDSKYILTRSTGELDIVEYDFRDGMFIEGDGRDGGRSMPDWYLTLERLTFEGATSRLNGVQVNTLSASDTFTASARINDGSYSAGTSTGASTSRWVRFPVSQLGLSHQVKISGDESVSGIDGVAIEYQMTSRSKVN